MQGQPRRGRWRAAAAGRLQGAQLRLAHPAFSDQSKEGPDRPGNTRWPRVRLLVCCTGGRSSVAPVMQLGALQTNGQAAK